MNDAIRLIDFSIVAAALFSAVFWFLASRQKMRRISRKEELDAADINRILTQLNRAQILNARAALMTALATLLAAMRLLIDALQR
jgi:hypothetical protein